MAWDWRQWQVCQHWFFYFTINGPRIHFLPTNLTCIGAETSLSVLPIPYHEGNGRKSSVIEGRPLRPHFVTKSENPSSAFLEELPALQVKNMRMRFAWKPFPHLPSLYACPEISLWYLTFCSCMPGIQALCCANLCTAFCFMYFLEKRSLVFALRTKTTLSVMRPLSQSPSRTSWRFMFSNTSSCRTHLEVCTHEIIS